jgi:hypothetical protein
VFDPIRKVPGSIPTVVTNNSERRRNVSVSIIAISHLKTRVEPTPETSCISNTPETMHNVQHSVRIMNQPLPQTFVE